MADSREAAAPAGMAASRLYKSALKGRCSPEFCQKGGPGFWFEAQHCPYCHAVADTDTATCEAGGLDALPVAHTVGALAPAPAGITLIRIVR